jgi:peptide/nickel transport system substrate-binding protein
MGTSRGGMTRRSLLASGMAMTAAGLILPDGMARAQDAPKKGGVFRVGIGHGSSTDTHDPGLWEHLYVQVFAAARHNFLIEI